MKMTEKYEKTEPKFSGILLIVFTLTENTAVGCSWKCEEQGSAT
jgi:hypothetical protein